MLSSKCRDNFQQLHSYDPSPVLYSVGLRSSFIRSLLLDLDAHGGNDPNVMLSLLLEAGDSRTGN